VVELVFEHKKLGALVVAFLLEYDAVLEHGALECDQTEVVVFFKLSEGLGDEGDCTLIVEHTAEWFIQNKNDASALNIVLRKEPMNRLFLLLKRGRGLAFWLLADVLQTLVVNLLAFGIQQLLYFLQSTKSECVRTVAIELDRLGVNAKGFIVMAVDEEVVAF